MTQRIPKIIHQIWLGKRPIPKQILGYMESWKQKHPSWRFILWTDENVFCLYNQFVYLKMNNVRQKADLLRYEILYRYGGVYVDIDMECIQNIEPLIENEEFFVGTEDNFYYSNELMGCVPHHALMKELVEGIFSSIQCSENKTIDEQTGPIYITKYLLWMPEVTVIEQRLLYPRIQDILDSKKCVYTAHHTKIFKQAYY